MLNSKLFQTLVMTAGAVLSACSPVESDTEKAHADCGEPVSSGPVAEAIRTLEEAGAASNVTGVSVEDAERMFWPGYLAVGQDGSLTTGAAILSKWDPAPWASSFDIKELDIKVHCDTAIAIGLSEALWIGAPEGAKPVHFRWLNVWTHSNDEWRLSATQFSRF